MDWLNYHHLLYFWMVAREGGLTRASRKLHVSAPAISSQIKDLEAALGERLFVRIGRHLSPTETGHLVYGYASDIFALGQEMLDAVKDRPTGRPPRVNVGVTEVMPKLLSRAILEPMARGEKPVRLVCVERSFDELLAELAGFRLDVVLADRPAGPQEGARVFNHLLGECEVSFLGGPRIARRLRPGFPRSLHGAPVCLPLDSTILRRSLERWFDEQRIKPVVLGEFADTALLQAFGQLDVAAFPVMSLIENEVRRREQVALIGRVEGVSERFYAITAERRITNPAVVQICAGARASVFGHPPRPASSAASRRPGSARAGRRPAQPRPASPTAQDPHMGSGRGGPRTP